MSGSGARRASMLWLSLAWMCWLVACGRGCTGCGEVVLAELKDFQGEVQRDVASSVGSWAGVAQGERFRLGDGLRTGREGNAQLDLSGDGVALVESNTVLRFLDRDPRGKNRYGLEEGAIRIDSGQYDLDVHTPRGMATLRKGSSVRIVSGDESTQFDVLVGTVAIDRDGQVEQLSAGDKLALGADGGAPPDEAAQPGQDAGRSRDASAAAGPGTPAPSRVGQPELALPAIDAMTLHAPSLPVTFAVQPPKCASPAERPSAELNGRAAAAEVGGQGFVLQLTRAGVHRLNLRCGRRLVRQSTLRVLRDAANYELPKSAPRVEVEADGRRYTVRYQNVIPVVSMRWSDAPESSSYTLVLRRNQREQSYSSKLPSRDLPAAELVEGNYDFWFVTDAGKKSSVGGLRIEFDNTARALSLSEPSDGASASGDEVLVSGVALLRSQVSANGVALPLDGKGRFRAQVPLTSERSVLVRSVHPAAGVHYYLRRLR